MAVLGPPSARPLSGVVSFPFPRWCLVPLARRTFTVDVHHILGVAD
jgi:hypothetical protein